MTECRYHELPLARPLVSLSLSTLREWQAYSMCVMDGSNRALFILIQQTIVCCIQHTAWCAAGYVRGMCTFISSLFMICSIAGRWRDTI